MRYKLGLAAAVALLSAASVWAHHSPSAEFDMSKRITVSGVLTKVDWINPHITLAMDVKNESGKVESWSFESNPPAWFRRVGVNRNDLAKAIGQTVTAEGVRSKDGSPFGYMQKITLADGTSLELATSIK
jgi:hypothetical protein